MRFTAIAEDFRRTVAAFARLSLISLTVTDGCNKLKCGVPLHDICLSFK